MSKRQRQAGPTTLQQLQNLVKRDKEGYRDEFLQQYRHYQSALDIFRLKPTEESEEFGQLVAFLSAVAPCYPNVLKAFPGELISLLEKHAEVLHPDLRQGLCRALILLRNRSLLPASTLLELFFKLFRCKDKGLRRLLYSHIVSDIRNLNAKHKNNTLNKTLQNFMFTMLQDPHVVAAKKSLDVMIELYIRGLWMDAKTVNIIAGATTSDNPKLAHTAIRFFLRTNEQLKAEVDEGDESDNEDHLKKTYERMRVSNTHVKKTVKRQHQLERALKAAKRAQRKQEGSQPNFHFAALQHINDPQTLAEKLLAKLRNTKNESYEAKLMTMNFISRLIGVHELFVLNFYAYCQRYLQPRQPDVTLVLTYLAQATHALIPPDSLESVIKTIADNFVSDRSTAESMAVGINAIREICARCPLAIDASLLEDLIQYKKYKDKSVIMAARSLIQLYREVQPSMLPKKERGKPTGEEEEKLEYGGARVHAVVPGTELLSLYNEVKAAGELPESDEENGWETASEDSDEDDEWITVEHSDDESSKASGPLNKRAKKTGDGSKADSKEEANGKPQESNTLITDEVDRQERLQRAAQLTATKLLTQEDFDKIKELQAKKMLAPAASTLKTERELAAILEPSALTAGLGRKEEREERIAKLMEARKEQGKHNMRKGKMSEFASTTNRDKAKRKNPMMLKHAAAARLKRKLSIREKQLRAQKSKEKDLRRR